MESYHSTKVAFQVQILIGVLMLSFFLSTVLCGEPTLIHQPRIHQPRIDQAQMVQLIALATTKDEELKRLIIRLSIQQEIIESYYGKGFHNEPTLVRAREKVAILRIKIAERKKAIVCEIRSLYE